MPTATLEALRHSANAALIIACTLAGSYIILLAVTLINPDGKRGKLARDLLPFHFFSRGNTQVKDPNTLPRGDQK